MLLVTAGYAVISQDWNSVVACLEVQTSVFASIVHQQTSVGGVTKWISFVISWTKYKLRNSACSLCDTGTKKRGEKIINTVSLSLLWTSVLHCLLSYTDSKETAVLLDASWILKSSAREWSSGIHCANSCSDCMHGGAARFFRGCGMALCGYVHWWFRIKWSRGKEHKELGVITTTKKKFGCLPGIYRRSCCSVRFCYMKKEVCGYCLALLVYQLFLHLVVLWVASVRGFVCLTPSSAPPCFQPFCLNSFLNFGGFILFYFYCDWTNPFHCEGMSYPGMVSMMLLK